MRAYLKRAAAIDAALVVLLLAVIRLWVQPLANSFWLDETLIVVLIRDNFAGLIQHSAAALQSILFCILEWTVSQFISPTEIALRLPSLLAGLGLLFVLCRLGRELGNSGTAVICAALAVAHPAITRIVPEARPYALALFLSTTALLSLTIWLRNRHWKYAAAWTVCAALACYFHHLFLIAAAFQMIAAARHRQTLRPLAAMSAGLGLLLLPLLPQMLTIAQYRQVLSYAGRAPVSELVSAIAPTNFVVGFVLSAIVLTISAGARWKLPDKRSETLWIGLITGILPVVALYMASLWSGVEVFTPRYLLPTAPGVVVFWSTIFTAVSPERLTKFICACTLAVAMFYVAGWAPVPDYHQEDWRSVVPLRSPQGRILLYTGLVESRRVDWLQDASKWRYLASPLLAYAPAETPTRVSLLPFEGSPEEQRYVDDLVSKAIRDRQTTTVIVRSAFSGSAWLSDITQRLTHAGFTERLRKAAGDVQIVILAGPEPRPTAPPATPDPAAQPGRQPSAQQPHQPLPTDR